MTLPLITPIPPKNEERLLVDSTSQAKEMGDVQLRTYAKYPFLLEATYYVRERGIALEEAVGHRALALSRRLAMERVLTSLQTGELDEPPLTNFVEWLSVLYSYPLARMLVSCVGDPFLIRRYALAEAEMARRRLAREEHDFLLRVCCGLSMDAYGDGAFHLHFRDFLHGTRRLRGKE